MNGWSKIAEAAVHTERDAAGGIVYEAVHVLTDSGDWFSVQLRHGERAEDLAESYRLRGWTDARCCHEGRREAAAASQRMHFRFRWEQRGGQVHVRVFVGKARDLTHALAGDLCFSPDEWDFFRDWTMLRMDKAELQDVELRFEVVQEDEPLVVG